MDSRFIVSEFKLQSCYYFHFQTNTLRKGMNPLILSAMGWITPLLFFQKKRMALAWNNLQKQRNQTNHKLSSFILILLKQMHFKHDTRTMEKFTIKRSRKYRIFVYCAKNKMRKMIFFYLWSNKTVKNLIRKLTSIYLFIFSSFKIKRKTFILKYFT